MAHTNRARVLLGGLLAGLVINIVEYIAKWRTPEGGLGPGDAGAGQIGDFHHGRDRDFHDWRLRMHRAQSLRHDTRLTKPEKIKVAHRYDSVSGAFCVGNFKLRHTGLFETKKK
jgi:hypothetical protein